MFVLIILERIKETKLKFSQGSLTVLQKMLNYQEAKVKYAIKQIKIFSQKENDRNIIKTN